MWPAQGAPGPKGHQRAYRQWSEAGVGPPVGFEAWAHTNTRAEMTRKRAFYDRFGVEEYYEYDPQRGCLFGWTRQGEHLAAVPQMPGWVSPRLGIRFPLEGKQLGLYRPDGERFLTDLELTAQREQAQQHAEHAEDRAEHAADRAERRAAQLRALGFEPEGG